MIIYSNLFLLKMAFKGGRRDMQRCKGLIYSNLFIPPQMLFKDASPESSVFIFHQIHFIC